MISGYMVVTDGTMTTPPTTSNVLLDIQSSSRVMRITTPTTLPAPRAGMIAIDKATSSFVVGTTTNGWVIPHGSRSTEPIRFDYTLFVNNVSGSDVNTGASGAQALKTITHALVVAAQASKNLEWTGTCLIRVMGASYFEDQETSTWMFDPGDGSGQRVVIEGDEIMWSAPNNIVAYPATSDAGDTQQPDAEVTDTIPNTAHFVRASDHDESTMPFLRDGRTTAQRYRQTRPFLNNIAPSSVQFGTLQTTITLPKYTYIVTSPRATLVLRNFEFTPSLTITPSALFNTSGLQWQNQTDEGTVHVDRCVFNAYPPDGTSIGMTVANRGNRTRMTNCIFRSLTTTLGARSIILQNVVGRCRLSNVCLLYGSIESQENGGENMMITNLLAMSELDDFSSYNVYARISNAIGDMIFKHSTIINNGNFGVRPLGASNGGTMSVRSVTIHSEKGGTANCEGSTAATMRLSDVTQLAVANPTTQFATGQITISAYDYMHVAQLNLPNIASESPWLMGVVGYGSLVRFWASGNAQRLYKWDLGGDADQSAPGPYFHSTALILRPDPLPTPPYRYMTCGRVPFWI